jgi:hypothetical protein
MCGGPAPEDKLNGDFDQGKVATGQPLGAGSRRNGNLDSLSAEAQGHRRRLTACRKAGTEQAPESSLVRSSTMTAPVPPSAGGADANASTSPR